MTGAERNSAENGTSAGQTIYCKTPGRSPEKGTALSAEYLGVRLCGAWYCISSVKYRMKRLIQALQVAKEWKGGNASVGDARKAAVTAHAVARESSDPAAIAVARSIGHAVATAHMADHALGAAWYALKAVKSAGQSPDAERRWQDERLPPGIKDLILTARKSRKI